VKKTQWIGIYSTTLYRIIVVAFFSQFLFAFLDVVCKLHINYALSQNCRRIFLSIWVSDFCFFDQHISLSEFQSSFCSKRVCGGGGGSGDHNAQEFLEEVQQFFSFLFDAKCFFGVIESLANPEPQSHRAPQSFLGS
jgi:hypothetical protein